MLLVANTSSIRNQTALLDLLSAEMVPVRLDLRRGQLKLELVRWREYWKPAMPFFECDARLVQRLNRLKRTWERLIARLAQSDRQRRLFISGIRAAYMEGDDHRTESKSFLVGRAIDLTHVQKGRRLW
jgi:hypothetical protein